MSSLGTNTAEKTDIATEEAKSQSSSSGRNLKTSTNSSATGMMPSQTAGPIRKTYSGKVKQTELILFTTQLAVMLDSGVVLSDALDAIAEPAENATFKMIIMDVAETVKGGENFSKALASYPKVFNSMFISMV
ncbi:MAG: type II secretion system F family protein, partial [Sedimentisphaerales bacterium]